MRYLRIEEVEITVDVEGVRNLIVQNEEGLQDINSTVYPFGSRPQLKDEFYTGSKEVFCKNWKNFDLHVEWKNKPDDLEFHYKDYGKELNLELDPPLPQPRNKG